MTMLSRNDYVVSVKGDGGCGGAYPKSSTVLLLADPNTSKFIPALHFQCRLPLYVLGEFIKQLE